MATTLHTIGFSTGALAYADFRKGLAMASQALAFDSSAGAIELSALRASELVPMLDALGQLDLEGFGYISIHAPSKIDCDDERTVADQLRAELWRGWPIVVHPDAIYDFGVWRDFGALLCIENMDKRKPIGRSLAELRPIFDKLPEASLCFDIGHARQIDTTMTEAFLILREFSGRMRQVHMSEVSTVSSRHNRLSYASIWAFQELAHWIPSTVPVILETPAEDLAGMKAEVSKARESLVYAPREVDSMAMPAWALP